MPGLILLALLLEAAPQPSGPTLEALAALRTRTSVELVNVDPADLAGLFQAPPADVGGLAGEDLHLFPDGTYVHCEWADVWPLTVHDKGHWGVSQGILELTSDPDITWDPGVDRQYLTIRRESETSEVLLFGLTRDLHILKQVEHEENDQDGRFLLFLGLSRSARYVDLLSAKQTKTKLLHRAWRPEAFREGS